MYDETIVFMLFMSYLGSHRNISTIDLYLDCFALKRLRTSDIGNCQ